MGMFDKEYTVEKDFDTAYVYAYGFLLKTHRATPTIANVLAYLSFKYPEGDYTYVRTLQNS